MTSCGATVLPSDFDIFRPCSSTTKPCVSTWRNGARPRVPRPTSSELWNQPRCWSLPSRYMSAGQRWSARKGSTASWLDPESNQTSRMFVLALELGAAADGHAQALGHELLERPLVPRVGAVVVEDRRRLLDERLGRARPRRTSRSRGPGSARPTTRWREMHQSGRFAIMLWMRSWPQAGIQRVSLRWRPERPRAQVLGAPSR